MSKNCADCMLLRIQLEELRRVDLDRHEKTLGRLENLIFKVMGILMPPDEAMKIWADYYDDSRRNG